MKRSGGSAGKRRSMGSSNRSVSGSRGKRHGGGGGGGGSRGSRAGGSRGKRASRSADPMAAYGSGHSKGSRSAANKRASRSSIGGASVGSASKHGRNRSGSRGSKAGGGSAGKRRGGANASRMSKAIRSGDKKARGGAGGLAGDLKKGAAAAAGVTAGGVTVEERQRIVQQQAQRGGRQPFQGQALLARVMLGISGVFALGLAIGGMTVDSSAGELGYSRFLGAQPGSGSQGFVEVGMPIMLLLQLGASFAVVSARSIRGLQLVQYAMAPWIIFALVVGFSSMGSDDPLAAFGILGIFIAALFGGVVFAVRTLLSALLGLEIRCLAPQQCSMFSEGLAKNQTALEERVGGVGPQGAATIAPGLAKNKSCVYLDLSVSPVDTLNAMGPSGALALAGALRSNKALMGLHLGNNGIGPAGASALTDALPSSGLVWLDVGDNHIGADAAVRLVKAAVAKKEFQNLNLQANDVTDAAALQMAQALKKRPADAQRLVLDLRFNPILPPPFDALVNVAEGAGSGKLYLQLGDFEDGACCV